MNDPTRCWLGPVTRGPPSSLDPRCWIITRYDDVVSVLRDPELFCSKDILSITELLSPEVIELFGDEIPMEGP